MWRSNRRPSAFGFQRQPRLPSRLENTPHVGSIAVQHKGRAFGMGVVSAKDKPRFHPPWRSPGMRTRWHHRSRPMHSPGWDTGPRDLALGLTPDGARRFAAVQMHVFYGPEGVFAEVVQNYETVHRARFWRLRGSAVSPPPFRTSRRKTARTPTATRALRPAKSGLAIRP
jgi:hypothetical protein